jgi:hypothetical protein
MTLCARIISTCHLRRQSQATSSRAVLRGALHRIAVRVLRRQPRARRPVNGCLVIRSRGADVGGASRCRRRSGGPAAVAGPLGVRRGDGGGEGRRFGVRRGGILGGLLDLRSLFGLCYCGCTDLGRCALLRGHFLIDALFPF